MSKQWQVGSRAATRVVAFGVVEPARRQGDGCHCAIECKSWPDEREFRQADGDDASVVWSVGVIWSVETMTGLLLVSQAIRTRLQIC